MKVAATMPDRMEIVGMAAHRSAQKLAEDANLFKPEALCLVDPSLPGRIAVRFNLPDQKYSPAKKV